MAGAKLHFAARKQCESSGQRAAHLRHPLLRVALLNDVGPSPAGVCREDQARHVLRVQQQLDVLLGLRAEADTLSANAVQAFVFGLCSPEGICEELMAFVVLCRALWRREWGSTPASATAARSSSTRRTRPAPPDGSARRAMAPGVLRGYFIFSDVVCMQAHSGCKRHDAVAGTSGCLTAALLHRARHVVLHPIVAVRSVVLSEQTVLCVIVAACGDVYPPDESCHTPPLCARISGVQDDSLLVVGVVGCSHIFLQVNMVLNP